MVAKQIGRAEVHAPAWVEGAPAVEHTAVRAHYLELAPHYARGANAICRNAFVELGLLSFPGAPRMLEIGAGSTPILKDLPATVRIACDLSVPMLRAAPREDGVLRVASDGARLPWLDESFDAAIAVNLLEHIPDPAALMAELRRVLVPGGRCLLVTPNGDHERILDLIERLRLKLPEGPHRFITFDRARELAARQFAVLDHRAFLAFPAGPRWLVRAVDRVLGQTLGLFQYLVLRK